MSIVRLNEENRINVRLYVDKKETNLLHANEPEPGYFITESFNVTVRAIDAGYQVESFFIDEESVDESVSKLFDKYPKVPAYVCPAEELKEITGYPMTRGLLACMKRKAFSEMADVVKDMRRVVVLDNVENPTNVGAIFRSAAALNMDAVILNKGCADPLYRRATRVSMGTVFQIPWVSVPQLDGTNTILALQKLGYKCIAMALKEDTINIDDPRLKKEDKLAIILGSEGYGMEDATINLCDYTVMIPMSHGVDSLNVATAGAIACYELGKK